jgi:enoyl-CoA hydratase
LDYPHFKFLAFERRPNGVLVITLNRPDKLNAVTTAMHRELGEIWLTIERDPSVRVAVVTGAGRAFSAGGDLKEDMVKLGEAEKIIEMGEEARAIVLNMIDLDKPIISAINGPADRRPY